MQRIKKTVFNPVALILALAALALLNPFPSPARAAGAGLLVTVDISPALKAGTDPGQAVFIYAKAVRGPKAPLAAVKTNVGSLPFTVTLDDTKALTPMFRMSGFKDVFVSARVSQSGTARKSSGDLEGVSQPISLDAGQKPVTVTIDHVVK